VLTPEGVKHPDVLQLGDTFQIQIEVNYENAFALKTMIDEWALSGKAIFTLLDGSKVESDLFPDTQIAGPWATGPIEVNLSAGSATLTNKIEQTVDVFDLVTRTGSNSGQTVEVNQSLASGASWEVALVGWVDEAYPIYSVHQAPITLKELHIFVEAATTPVFFINEITCVNHALTKLQIQARLKDTQHVYHVDINEGQSKGLEMIHSLISLGDPQILQFQVTKTFSNNQLETTLWLEQNLIAPGIVVDITWELIR